MYLKRLEIFGFKSFAEKTILNFEQGVTAVVGPNGCGKSNVFDSIRWVLGEQSVKDLRGSSMEDVIFSGTDKKAPLGFAEVSLTFSNETKVLPVEYDEVTVTRRLFRSGESEYLINKNQCRLRDIVELFLGTGVGAEAYSLIQQGRVDLVVSAKPDDRRQIFDEAAGITKYKAKKKEALSKLKETEDNLLRINDIVVEIKRQIATIERQAKKAQQYKESFDQLKGFELIMATHQMRQHDAKLLELNTLVRTLETKEAQLAAQMQEWNNRIEHEEGLLAEVDEQLSAIKSNQMRVDNDIDLNTRQITFNEERLGNIEENVIRLDAQREDALNRCQAHQARIDGISEELQAVERAAGEHQGKIDAKRQELDGLMNAINQAKESIAQIEAQKFEWHAKEVRIKNQLTENMKRNMELLARKTRLEAENSKVADERVQINARFEAINDAINQVKGQLEQAWGEHSVLRQTMDTLKNDLANQETLIDDLERKRVFNVSQKDFIAQMQTQYQDIPDPVVEGRFITSISPTENQTGIIGKIKNITALAPNEQGQVLYEIVYETKFVELDLGQMQQHIDEIDGQLLSAQARKEELIASCKTQDESVSIVLKGIQDLEKRLSVLESQKNDVELQTGKLSGELDVLTMEFSQVEGELASLKIQEEDLNQQLHDLSQALNKFQEDIRIANDSIAQFHVSREQVNIALAQLETEGQGWNDKLKGLNESLSIFKQNLERDQSEQTRCQDEVAALTAKKAGLNEEIAQLNQSVDALKSKSAALAVEVNDLSNQKNEMSLRLNSLKSQTRGIEDEIIQAKTDIHQYQMSSQQIEFDVRTLKERLMQRYQIDWDQMLQIPASEQEVSDTPQPEVNYDELALEIERLRKKCDSYGAVNLVAIEEFEELKNRYEFLTKQQSDLLTAREQILSTIQKINRTTRQMFTETFTKVNEEFQIYFRMLFGGGEAQLILLDPENALESGIDIIARPPGKKLQNISLLSGGEKTLTAIALIFGVFKVNPSPFCVLDEIDAALDESNVGRFANLLKEFAKIAQFIVITHNKKTMSSADVMYGVTMQERGVSRIVSVKFNEANAKPAENVQVPETAGAV